MEEEQGAVQRAAELRSYRMQGFNEIVLPAGFGAGLGSDTPDSPFNSVINTVGVSCHARHSMLLRQLCSVWPRHKFCDVSVCSGAETGS